MIKSGGIAMAMIFTTVGSINLWSMPLFAVPLTVIGVALLGAVLGAGYGKPLEKRRDLFITVMSHTFLAATLVAVGPKLFGLEWVTPVLEAPLAGLLAFAGKFVLPVIPWGEIVRKVARLEPKKEKNE